LAVGNEGLANPDYDVIMQLKNKGIIDHYKFAIWIDEQLTGHLQIGNWNNDGFLDSS
jgi:hypothetical protein